jgi:serine/threonine protein kinase
MGNSNWQIQVSLYSRKNRISGITLGRRLNWWVAQVHTVSPTRYYVSIAFLITIQGAPEQTSRVGSREFYQTIDVWALGCVFSIAATWIALGHQGVRQYAQLREAASRRVVRQQPQRASMLESPELGYGDYFHDGKDVLPEVTDWHKYLRNILRRTDRVTAQVLDVVDHYMFVQDPRKRWQSSEIYDKLYKISLGLEDPTSTVPQEIIDFISANEQGASGGPGAIYDKTVPPVNQDATVVRKRKDKKSKYLRPLIIKTEGPTAESSQAASTIDRSPLLPPETPNRSHINITNGPYYQSPTQSMSFSTITTYDRPETPLGKHPLEVVQIKPPAQATFRGKVQDIFQAHEEIEESERMRNKIKLMGKKPVDDYLAKHYQKRDIVSLGDVRSFLQICC